MMTNGESARLDDRYDLIGFDPRGAGYSTKVTCANGGPGGPPTSGPLTEAAARATYDAGVAANVACGQSDPDFLGQLTTTNVARDLERVRIALGERKLNFVGVSWGTWLGAVYRSTFPGSVGRMFLDSVAAPEFTVDSFDDGRAAAVERESARLAAWIAAHHDTYGFGTSTEQVRAAILALVHTYDANPKQYTDLGMPADGAMIARLSSQDSRDWTRVSQALAELRDSTGTTAPPTVKAIFDAPPHMSPPGAPEILNPTMQQATVCNEDPARFDFATAWAEYQQRLAQNPVTGRAIMFSAGCAGWPLPAGKSSCDQPRDHWCWPDTATKQAPRTSGRRTCAPPSAARCSRSRTTCTDRSAGAGLRRRTGVVLHHGPNRRRLRRNSHAVVPGRSRRHLTATGQPGHCHSQALSEQNPTSG